MTNKIILYAIIRCIRHLSCVLVVFMMHNCMHVSSTCIYALRYVQEDILQPEDPNYRQFHKIFEAFKLSEVPEKPKDPNSVSELVAKAAEASKKLAQQRKYQPQEEEEEEEDKVCVCVFV